MPHVSFVYLVVYFPCVILALFNLQVEEPKLSQILSKFIEKDLHKGMML